MKVSFVVVLSVLDCAIKALEKVWHLVNVISDLTDDGVLNGSSAVGENFRNRLSEVVRLLDSLKSDYHSLSIAQKSSSCE